jgi:glycosyltransferase involved in cell wall biosynthesis
MAASDVVCQPSLAEPFGLVTLEGMACGRTVVATSVGGPPEFVTDAGGVIVDPYDEDALGGALSEAARFPHPNVAARAAAEDHDIKRQAERVEALLARACRDRRA